MLQNRTVYKNQFAMMAFISIVVFKLAMLPKYMSIASGNDSWIAVMLMLAIEIVMIYVVYYITAHIDVLTETPRYIMYPLSALIFFISNARGIVLFSSLLDYTTTTLFDQNRYTFIIVIFAPVLAYFVFNGGNVLARLAEIVFYMAITVLVLMVILAKIDIDWLNILPILSDGGKGMARGMYTHFMWFGDFIPLLFFKVVDNRQRVLSKISLPLCMTGAFTFVVMFYIVFIGVYGEAGVGVNFAFNTLAIFNKISEVLGTTNIVSVISWLFMALIQLSLLLYSATVALSYLIKKWWLALMVNIVGVMLTVMFWIQNVDKAYMLATSPLGYFVGATQYAIPIALLIYTVIYMRKKRERDSGAVVGREDGKGDESEVSGNVNLGGGGYAKG